MRQKIAALISAILVSSSIAGLVRDKISHTEAGTMLVAVLAYWVDPPKESIEAEIRKGEDKGD
jgi:hypothetical protein